MNRRILLLSKDDACLVTSDGTEWAKNNLVICKTDSFEETVNEIKNGCYLLIIVAMDKENSNQVQTQIKILRSLTTAPIAVIAEEPVDITLRLNTLYDGADQFLPLSSSEAAASSLALIRRFTELNKGISPVTVYYDHGVLLSVDHRKAYVGNIEVVLTKKEFDILSLLIRNHAKVLGYEYIYQAVWGDDETGNAKDVLWTQIRRLRKKLQFDPALPGFIKTVRDVGYSFDPQYRER